MSDDPVEVLQRRLRAIQRELEEADVGAQALGDDHLGRSAFAAVTQLTEVVGDLLAMLEPAETD